MMRTAAAHGARAAVIRGGRVGGGQVGGGQVDGELGAVAVLGLQLDVPAVGVHQAAGQGETQSGAAGAAVPVADLLELLEDPRLVLVGDARAGVGDGDRDVVARPGGR